METKCVIRNEYDLNAITDSNDETLYKIIVDVIDRHIIGIRPLRYYVLINMIESNIIVASIAEQILKHLLSYEVMTQYPMRYFNNMVDILNNIMIKYQIDKTKLINIKNEYIEQYNAYYHIKCGQQAFNVDKISGINF